MAQFDIIQYMRGLLDYPFSDNTLQTIAMERGVQDVSDYSQLEQKQKDLLLADMLRVIYFSPSQTASETKQHGSFTHTKGSSIYNSKKDLYNYMMSLYRKWDDANLETIEGGSLQWLF